MTEEPRSLVTTSLKEASQGDEGAAARLWPLVDEELRRIAAHYFRRERPGHTLQATALVHEAYLELVDESQIDWAGRTHFLAVAATAMRRILVQHARARAAQKRGGGRERVTLSILVDEAEPGAVDLLDLDDALTELASLHGRAAKVVELTTFGDMTRAEIAWKLGVSASTVRDDKRFALAWLRVALGGDTPE